MGKKREKRENSKRRCLILEMGEVGEDNLFILESVFLFFFRIIWKVEGGKHFRQFTC